MTLINSFPLEEDLLLHQPDWTIAQYEAMVDTGVLDEEDRVELLFGKIVKKMPTGVGAIFGLNRLNQYTSGMKISATLLLLLVSCFLWAQADEDQRNTHYPTNQAPLVAQPYTELPLGAIKPHGWLRKMLELQRDGLTGHLDSMYSLVIGPHQWLAGRQRRRVGARPLLARRPNSAGLPARRRGAEGKNDALDRVEPRKPATRRLLRPHPPRGGLHPHPPGPSRNPAATGGPAWLCSKCSSSITRPPATNASSPS